MNKQEIKRTASVITRNEAGDITEIREANANDALELIESAIGCQNPTVMRDNLRELMDHWFITSEGDDIDRKNEMYCTFQTLTDLLSGCEILQIAINGTGLQNDPVM